MGHSYQELGAVNSQVMGNEAWTEWCCPPQLMNQLHENPDYLLHGSEYHENPLDIILQCLEHRRPIGRRGAKFCAID